MSEIFYVLCEHPEQKLYFHSYRYFHTGWATKVETTDAQEDMTLASKTILKMVNLREIALCWCTDGIYAWSVTNGNGSPLTESVIHPVFKYPKSFFPLAFFDDKTVLDIAVSTNFYILCEDGVYVIPSKVEDNRYTKCSKPKVFSFTESRPEPKITILKLSFFDDNIPLIFSSYWSFKSNLGKSARKINLETPVAKKQKIDDKNE